MYEINEDSHPQDIEWEFPSGSFQFRQSSGLGILIVNGEMTADREDHLRGAISSSLGRIQHLLVYFEKLVDTDNTLIELLCSAHKGCVSAGKKMSLIGDQAEILKKLVRDFGPISIAGCIGDCGGACLWN
jgi:anti-anti-sigma regulatory factor